MDQYDRLWLRLTELVEQRTEINRQRRKNADKEPRTNINKELAEVTGKHPSYISKLLSPKDATYKPASNRATINEDCKKCVRYLEALLAGIRVNRDLEAAEQLQAIFPFVEFDVVGDTLYFPVVALTVATRIVELVDKRSCSQLPTTILTPGGPGPLGALEALLSLRKPNWQGVTIGPALNGGWDPQFDPNSPRQVVEAAGEMENVRCARPETSDDWAELWDRANVVFMSVGNGPKSFFYEWFTKLPADKSKDELAAFAGDVMYFPFDRFGERINTPLVEAALDEFHVIDDIETRLRTLAREQMVLLGVDRLAKAEITAIALRQRFVTRCVLTESVARQIMSNVDGEGYWKTADKPRASVKAASGS